MRRLAEGALVAGLIALALLLVWRIPSLVGPNFIAPIGLVAAGLGVFLGLAALASARTGLAFAGLIVSGSSLLAWIVEVQRLAETS